MKPVFSFKISTEDLGQENLWLVFENGMINLSVIADSKPGIIGKQFKKAIKNYFNENKETAFSVAKREYSVTSCEPSEEDFVKEEPIGGQLPEEPLA